MRSVRSLARFAVTVVPVAALAGLVVFTAPRAAYAQSFNYNFATGSQGFVSTVGTGNAAAAWTYSPTAGVGGVGAWFTNGSSTVTQVFLTSPNLVLTQSGTINGSFTHRFNFEAATAAGSTVGFDGGIIEYSTNGGAWTQVGTSLVTGQGYNKTISTEFSSSLGGLAAFSGTSTGYATPAYVTTNFTLGTTAAQSFTAGNVVRFRFNAAYDNSVALPAPDWLIGNISFNVTPEPGTLSLLGMGLAGGVGALGIVRLKRKTA